MLSNYEVHLKNRQHRQRVSERINGGAPPSCAAGSLGSLIYQSICLSDHCCRTFVGVHCYVCILRMLGSDSVDLIKYSRYLHKFPFTWKCHPKTTSSFSSVA